MPPSTSAVEWQDECGGAENDRRRSERRPVFALFCLLDGPQERKLNFSPSVRLTGNNNALHYSLQPPIAKVWYPEIHSHLSPTSVNQNFDHGYQRRRRSESGSQNCL